MLKGLGPHRRKSNLSQQELAIASGLSQPYISQLESGRADRRKIKPPYETVVLLSKILKTTPETLQEGDKYENESAPEEDRVRKGANG